MKKWIASVTSVNECGTLAGWYWQAKNEIFSGKKKKPSQCHCVRRKPTWTDFGGSKPLSAPWHGHTMPQLRGNTENGEGSGRGVLRSDVLISGYENEGETASFELSNVVPNGTSIQKSPLSSKFTWCERYVYIVRIKWFTLSIRRLKELRRPLSHRGRGFVCRDMHSRHITSKMKAMCLTTSSPV